VKNKIINILTSYTSPKKVCVSGNDAISRSALEWGIDGVFSYPGTPSTEVSEAFSYVNKFQTNSSNQEAYPELCKNPVYFEYSINEKIALEKAIAYSIGNKSAMCVMKNVGMNVAADALMSITYQTIIAPLVIVLCDDPGCHSSSNEQDSRYWGAMASVPVFNPSTAAEAYQMTKAAFELSEKLHLPVILRMTTRVSHARGMLFYNSMISNNRSAQFDRLPEHINIPARTSAAHQKLLDKLQSDILLPFFAASNEIILPKSASIGIVSSGVSTAYVNEVLNKNELNNDIARLNLGLIHPFPEKDILTFLNSGLDKILILEELEPLLENAIRVTAQKHNLSCEIYGKGFSGINSTGEFSIDSVQVAIESFSGATLISNQAIIEEGQVENLPPRPPALCAGCPHRATFYALKLAVPREYTELILCGDIGCFGLGALPPLKMIDTVNHMGMSISMAQGLSEAFRTSKGRRKTVAMMGDGTFFHSGVASLLNAIHTNANILLIIFDNRTTGMTGGQDHPGANKHNKDTEIAIEPLVRGMGVSYVDMIDPFNVRKTFQKIDAAMKTEGVSVVVSRSPCVFLPDYSLLTAEKPRIEIDASRCNTCHNHSDLEISCSRKQSPKSSLSRARAKIAADISIDATEQLCPANICNHGFFNSILEGNYKSALDIVRDKMLFARSCGDICHRPCELFSSNEHIIPIKELKKFVSKNPNNFHDFSIAKKQIETVEKKNKKVAIIGGGPAGLSAAYDLIRNGYEVEVFEKGQAMGGLVKFAIPNFRMDKHGFDYEVNVLTDLGVKFNFGYVLGFNMNLEELSSEYDAVLLAIGMSKVKLLDVVQKIPEDKRTDALAFLHDFNTEKLELKPSSIILIVGGGNSAMDAARSAKYFDKNNRVIVSCIEKEGMLPAFKEEVEHAKEEGIEFITDSYVKSCSVRGTSLLFELNQFSTKDALQNLEIDYVITAIGQGSEEVLFKNSGLDLDAAGRILVDNKTGLGRDNIFVAGDLCANNHMSVIGAIASGKRAATGIRGLLENYEYEYEGSKALGMLNKNTSKQMAMTVKISEDLLDDIGQFNFFQACQKCNHCIDNFGCPALVKVNGKVQIDEPKCTHCGLCIDVCPNDAIQWVKSEKLVTV